MLRLVYGENRKMIGKCSVINSEVVCSSKYHSLQKMTIINWLPLKGLKIRDLYRARHGSVKGLYNQKKR